MIYNYVWPGRSSRQTLGPTYVSFLHSGYFAVEMSFKTRWARKSLYYYAFSTLISNISASPITITTARNNLISVTPTPVSVTPSFVSTLYENTHTSTIGADGYATSVPIVGGSECWVGDFFHFLLAINNP